MYCMYSGFSTDHIKPNMPFKYQYIVVLMKSLIHLIKQNTLGSAIHQQYEWLNRESSVTFLAEMLQRLLS